MKFPGKSPLIGYSAFHLFDQAYELNENACYVADSQESLKESLNNFVFDLADYRLDSVNLRMIKKDYGCTCGEFAFEPEALKRFEKAAKEAWLKYNVAPYELLPDELFVVNIEG